MRTLLIVFTDAHNYVFALARPAIDKTHIKQVFRLSAGEYVLNQYLES